MGVCESIEQEDTDQQWQAAVEQQRHAAEKKAHDEAVAQSSLILLHCAAPPLELQVRELQTVLEVLQMVAEKIGLPKAAAAWLQMRFGAGAEAIAPHHNTLTESGLQDQGEFSLNGLDQAETKVDEASKLDIHNAVVRGKLSEVRFVCTLTPARANEKSRGRVSRLPGQYQREPQMTVTAQQSTTRPKPR